MNSFQASRLAVSILVTWFSVASYSADEADSGEALARKIVQRSNNDARAANMLFKTTNKKGQVRNREALMAHIDEPEVTRLAIYFIAPAMIENSAFLSFDRETGSDENWLYLPTTERVRRIPSSDRGKYFMGTDLTYGDVQDNFKFALADWDFSHGGTQSLNGRTLPVLLGSAKDKDIAKDMGYASFTAVVDTQTLFPIEIAYNDVDNEPLKTMQIHDQEMNGNAWTTMRFTVKNLQTGHNTEVTFENMRPVPNLPDEVFDPDMLEFGPLEEMRK